MNNRLQKYGPWAVVTGASDGLGREYARALAAEGFKLVLVARREPELHALAKELKVETRVVPLDLLRPEALAMLYETTDALHVGLLVAAAGYGTSGAFLDSPLEHELGMIDVNCRAVASLTHHFGKLFVKRNSGAVVLLSSLVSFQGVKFAANYAATKAWVQTFAEGLALELAPFGVDVLSVAPGPVRSGFGARANMQMSMAQTPASVARASLRSLSRGGTVRPGVLSKVLEWALMFLPRWGRVRMMSVVMGGMTKHQLAAIPAAQK
jgi:short-subunit dehydrogenase